MGLPRSGNGVPRWSFQVALPGQFTYLIMDTGALLEGCLCAARFAPPSRPLRGSMLSPSSSPRARPPDSVSFNERLCAGSAAQKRYYVGPRVEARKSFPASRSRRS